MICAFPGVVVAGERGDGWSGKWWGNFPGHSVLPRLVPHVVITVSVVAIVTLGESLGDVLGADAGGERLVLHAVVGALRVVRAVRLQRGRRSQASPPDRESC